MKPLITLSVIASAGVTWHLHAKPRTAGESNHAAVAVQSVMVAEVALRDIPLRHVVEAATGHKILPLQPAKAAADTACRDHISRAADRVIAFLNSPESPVKRFRRINEASRVVEDKLVELLASGDFACAFPRTLSGAAQRSGYPDLRILHKPSGRIYFLDPKLYEAGSGRSTLRTFYYEPKELTGKIHDDGCHLILGISHDGKNSAWRFTGWQLVDLYDFRVRLKAEFQASNKDLYRDELIVGRSPK